MRKKRILIVDDSVVIRRALTDALSREPDLIVAGSASNGRVALMKIPLLHPDVVVLDLEMAGTALETLVAIRASYPALHVIILNTPTGRGSAATLDALSLGARDSVTKPDTTASPSDGLQFLCDELASKIALCSSSLGAEEPFSETPATVPSRVSPLPTVVRRGSSRVDVLAIGVSTGGPCALMDLIPRFPKDFSVPIVIVQHMPSTFTKLLAERLAARCQIRVAEGRLHQALLPGHAWIAPGNLHMAVQRDRDAIRIVTHRDPPENSCRPAADVLFRSVAQVYESHVLAVVMTGMGCDGLAGCQDIHDAGGQVFVQDEASSVVWGMPGFIVKAGLADRVLPLGELAAEIMERVSRHRTRRSELVSD